MQDTFVASSSVKLESKSSIFNKIKSIVHYSLKVFLNFLLTVLIIITSLFVISFADTKINEYSGRQAAPLIGAYVIVSPSMVPTIKVHDAILVARTNPKDLNVGDIIYTNLYRPMIKVITDDVGEHDLLHPCCRPEMYDFFYHNGEEHPNCFDNINRVLDEQRAVIVPVNLFMHTKISTNGSISVEEPVSKAGDKIVLKALMDITLGVAACSVSESKCNRGTCSPVKIVVD